MAAILLGAAGAGIGAAIGGGAIGAISLGWSIGSTLGSVLFNKGTHTAAQQESIMDLKVPGTDYGDTIPYARGAVLTAGQYWWNSDRRAMEISQAEGGKGKGKGGGKNAEQPAGPVLYEMDGLIGLTDNVIVGIRRVFDNGRLIWTADVNAEEGSLNASAVTDAWDRLTVYTGADDQLPDPIYEADVGTENACAYRGRGSVFIQGIKLGPSGQVRNFQFEVVVDGNGGMPAGRVVNLGTVPTITGSRPALGLVDPNTGYIWSTPQSFFSAGGVTVGVNSDELEMSIFTDTQTSGLAFASAQSMCYVPSESGALGNQIWILVNMPVGHNVIVKYLADEPAFFEKIDLGYFGTGLGECLRYDPVTEQVVMFCHGGSAKVINPINTTIVSTFTFGLGGTVWVPEVVVTESYFAIFCYGSHDVLDLVRLSDYTLYRRVIDSRNGALPYYQVAYDSNRQRLITFSLDNRDYTVIKLIDGTFTTHTLADAQPANIGTTPPPNDVIKGVIFSGDIYAFVSTNGGANGGTAFIVDPDSYLTLYEVTYVPDVTPMIVPTLLAPIDTSATYIFAFDSGHVKRLYIASNTVELVCPTLQDVVEGLLDRSGLPSSHYDMSNLTAISRHVCSFSISQITSTRTPLEMLMSAFSFEMYLSGSHIKARVRGGASVLTIPYEDLGASQSADSPEEPLVFHQLSDLEIPAQIALTYINIDNDYQSGVEVSDRLVSTVADTVAPYNMALGLHPEEAKGISNSILLDQASATITTKLSLIQKYSHLEPTDPIKVVDKDNIEYRLRVTKKIDSYPRIQLECIIDEPSALQSSGITSLSYETSTTVGAPALTEVQLLDIPIIADSDNNGGFYAVAKGTSTNWGGGALLASPDGVSYTLKSTTTSAGKFGDSGVLGDWTGPRVFDEMNTVTVDIGTVGSPTLESYSRDEILNSQQKNLALVGHEVIQFATATLISPGVYELSSLLRGGRGTEWAMTGHVAGEDFVMLSAGLMRINLGTSELGLPQFYKGLTIGRRLSTASTQSFTDTGIGLKPFSPVDLRAFRDVSDNITFTWQRRTRLETRSIGTLGISVPLGEDTESYSLDIYSDNTFATVVRTITAATTTASYSAAEQIADGLTPGDEVYVRVYQISAIVGRGYPLETAA